MKWKELLSDERLRHENRMEGRDLRSAFGRDSHRIIESASFRRLQDKTQVFPLDRSDFIRTRLTHSLEVASIGKSLAQNVGESIIRDGLDPEFTWDMKDALCDVMECAGLIHDIGNPPFGHFGEEAIREWFRKHLSELMYKGKPVLTYLAEEEREDLLHFEGNAQGLRLLTKLHFPVSDGGMNLTAAVLASTIKYPHSSLEIDSSGSDAASHKMGYMASEKEEFAAIEAITHADGKRTPMTFLLEAADDIAYSTADIEDAFKKGFFSYDEFVSELSIRGVRKQEISELQKLHDMALMVHVRDAGEYAIRRWLLSVQDYFISEVTVCFSRDYEKIMSGKRKKELISDRTPRKLLEALQGIAYDYAFTSMSIYKTEIAAQSMLSYLLENLVPATLQYDAGEKPGLMEEKYLSLISENYRQVYDFTTRGKSDGQKVYNRILLATDSVSGMTDSHARDLCAELKAGFTSPG